jgi:glutathione synthase/RimK-type ligase-like ATP-grasp enzyme
LTVLLLGRDGDLHIDAIVLALARRHAHIVRLDPERITPENTHISWRSDTATIDSYDGKFETNKVQGILCRYAIEALLPESQDAVGLFVFNEFWTALRAALLNIPKCRWINDPFCEAAADHKPLQLSIAERVGLKIPPTVVTQDRDELARFSELHGRCIIKPISDTGLARQNGSYVNEVDPSVAFDVYSSFTARFDPSTLHQQERHLICPVMLQAEIEKDFDIRVTVVDDSVYAAKLQDPRASAEQIDIRNTTDVAVSKFDISSQADQIAEIVHRLGLRAASCDFVAREGELFFLEANPSGNWLWTEHGADLSIGEAFSEALLQQI